MRWLNAGLFAVVVTAALVLVVFVLSKSMYVPFVSDQDINANHNLATLPGTLHLCGRSWHKDPLARVMTSVQVLAQSDVSPAVADPLLFAPCPSGACGGVAASEPCHTVVWVKVDDDGFISYELSGGP